MHDPGEWSVERRRREAGALLDPERKSQLGQFMTPRPIAEFMASMFLIWPEEVRLLDPGAGVGSLTDAFTERFFARALHGARLAVTTYEVEPVLLGHLREHLRHLEQRSREVGKQVQTTVISEDFINQASFELGFEQEGRFTHAILNPPYKKIGSLSEHRKMLRSAGIETVNLYAAFVALSVALVRPGGEIVAIVPRSFCNGTYFEPFRKWLLERVAIRRIHVFERRDHAFQEDEVLQENVIVHLERSGKQDSIVISESEDASLAGLRERSVPLDQIVYPDDPSVFIRVPTLSGGESEFLFHCTLEDLGVQVSTGPVVDFRLQEYWADAPGEGAVPLLYPHNFDHSGLRFPIASKKPCALRLCDDTRKWLLPRGYYTVVRRFSSKEEKRRIVAHVVDPSYLPYPMFGFENHLNVFHIGKQGLPPDLALGLSEFLNTAAVDQFFRQFSGHTQVNANDLRVLRYPDRGELELLGGRYRNRNELSREPLDDHLARIQG